MACAQQMHAALLCLLQPNDPTDRSHRLRPHYYLQVGFRTWYPQADTAYIQRCRFEKMLAGACWAGLPGC